MALRGQKPKDVQKRLKLLLYGPAKVGKTTAAIQMPKPYIIDCEKGTENYADVINEHDGHVWRTNQLLELIEEVRTLRSEQHDFLTLVIDPITLPYADRVDYWEKTVGSAHGAHYGKANIEMGRLRNLLVDLDMNVIVIAHAKPLYNKKHEEVGITFDGWKRLDYMFDLVLELSRQGRQRMATVKGGRLEKQFPEDSTFEWSYAAVADMYGRDLLERDVQTVQLANPEQVQTFGNLLNELSTAEQEELGITKALANVSVIADLPEDRIVKGIYMIKRHLAQRGNGMAATGWPTTPPASEPDPVLTGANAGAGAHPDPADVTLPLPKRPAGTIDVDLEPATANAGGARRVQGDRAGLG